MSEVNGGGLVPLVESYLQASFAVRGHYPGDRLAGRCPRTAAQRARGGLVGPACMLRFSPPNLGQRR